MALSTPFTFVVLMLSFLSCYTHDVFAWRQLDGGLRIAEFEATIRSQTGDSKIVIIHIDPAYYALRLLCSSEHNTGLLTVEEWADNFGQVAVINASMYIEDYKTSTGFMKNFRHINNATINSKFGAFFAFNPVDSSLPKVQIIDRYHQDWETLLSKYQTVVQNYRMISARQENLWRHNKQIHSIAAVGMDKQGNILFIISRSPYSVYDLNRILLSLPIAIHNAMYVEGGPDASLYIQNKDFTGKWMGIYGLDFMHEPEVQFLSIPNAIGIEKKPEN